MALRSNDGLNGPEMEKSLEEEEGIKEGLNLEEVEVVDLEEEEIKEVLNLEEVEVVDLEEEEIKEVLNLEEVEVVDLEEELMVAERTRVAKRRRDAYTEINRRLDAYPIDKEWTRDDEPSTDSVLAFFRIPNQRHDWRVASKEDIVGYLPTGSKMDQRSFCGVKFAQSYDRTAGSAKTPTTHAKSFPGESQEKSFLPDVAVEVEVITSDSRITKSSVAAIPLDSYGKHSNSDGITTVSRLAKKDSALKRIKSQNCILFFAYEVSEAILHDVAARLKLRYSKLLTEDVTHVIYKTSVNNGEDHLAPFGWEYMFGLAKGLWQVSYQWIVKSLDHSRCLPLTAFEIKGCCEPTDDKHRLLNYQSFVGSNGVPGLARANREKGNPGLFDGFKFYFYPGNLNMENLECLAVHAGAKVITHEPTPENIDLLECSSRFHTYENKNHQFSLTSHVIVYSDSKPPPETKKYNMVNLKTLKLDWLVDSLGHFQLLHSESYFYN